jgi:hypothetical protein
MADNIKIVDFMKFGGGNPVPWGGEEPLASFRCII